MDHFTVDLSLLFCHPLQLITLNLTESILKSLHFSTGPYTKETPDHLKKMSKPFIFGIFSLFSSADHRYDGK